MIETATLQHITWECLHFITPDEEPVARAGLEERGIAVFEACGVAIKNADDLLDTLAQAMQFPEYFGRNWDALDECLRDMSWLPARGYVLFLHDARRLWQQASDVAGQFVETWLFTAEEWSRSGIPFHLVFVW
jgi:RNAse (barnase) inhibitor barstar